ncbi:MAG: hypothetical protein IPM93_23065 [Candidatus Obscuribacter sp.]|nr:hypothetical protein [Candidatus Obscuribacter sp.]
MLKRRQESKLMIVLFMAALAGAGLATALSYKPHQLLHADGRYAADLPTLRGKLSDLIRVCRELDSCILDHMVARSELIAWRNKFIYQVFQASGASNVAVGKDNWLYFLNPSSTTEALGLSPFSEADLDLWCRGVEARAERLRLKGRRFVLVIGPSKEEIYPEYLAASLRRAVGGVSRLEQLTQRLKQRGKVKVVDLRPTLLAHKGEAPLYFKTDTHWNGLGSYYAYCELLKALQADFPALKPLPLSGTVGVAMEGESESAAGKGPVGGDLSRMLGLDRDRSMSEDLKIRFPEPCHWRLVGPDGSLSKARALSIAEHMRTVATTGDTNGPRLLMLRDSYAIALVPLLAEHFSKSAFLWQRQLPADIVEKEKPDVVVWEFVQRALYEDLNWESELRQVEPVALPGASKVLVFGAEPPPSAVKARGAKVLFNGGTFLQFAKGDGFVEVPLPSLAAEPLLSLKWRLCQDGDNGLNVEVETVDGKLIKLFSRSGAEVWRLPVNARKLRLKHSAAPCMVEVGEFSIYRP